MFYVEVFHLKAFKIYFGALLEYWSIKLYVILELLSHFQYENMYNYRYLNTIFSGQKILRIIQYN